VKYIVDTHALVWHLTSDERLGSIAQSILASPESEIIIPIIALAEARHIAARKRIAITFEQILQVISNDIRCTVLPLDFTVLAHMPDALDIHDSLIVSAALYYRDFLGEPVAVLTRDLQISQSGLVDVMW
jgi:PIN domain nuclease of toxin-antitoxin system